MAFRLSLSSKDIHWKAVRSSGPGGQNVNKVSSKIELWFDLRNTTVLTPEAKARLHKLARNRIDREGQLLIVSQRTRDQKRNLADAFEKLMGLIYQATEPVKVRRKTKPTRASKQKRLDEKRKQSMKKQRRGKNFLNDI